MADPQEEKPRSKQKKQADENGGSQADDKAKKKKILLLVSAVGAGCFVLSLCCAGTAVGVYYVFFSGPSIAGKWNQTGLFARSEQEWEFHRGGTGQTKIKTEFIPGKVEKSTGHFDYKLIQGDPLVLEMKLTRIEGDIAEGAKREIGQTHRFKVVLEGETMRLTKLDPQLKLEETITLTRIR